MELRLWCGKLHLNAYPGMPIAVGSALQVTGVQAGDEVGRVLLVQALSLALHCPHQCMAMGNVTQSHWVSVVLSVKSGQSFFACFQAGGWTRYFLKVSSSFKIFYSGGNYKANSWWWRGLKKTRRESIWTGFDYHCRPPPTPPPLSTSLASLGPTSIIISIITITIVVPMPAAITPPPLSLTGAIKWQHLQPPWLPCW